MPVQKNKKGVPIKNLNDDNQSVPLTESQLEQSCQESYKFDVLDIQTNQEKIEEEKEKEAQRLE